MREGFDFRFGVFLVGQCSFWADKHSASLLGSVYYGSRTSAKNTWASYIIKPICKHSLKLLVVKVGCTCVARFRINIGSIN